MITAVDTSVLLDLFLADQEFLEGSLEALERASREGVLIACEVVWAEVTAAFGSSAEAATALAASGVTFSPSTEEIGIRTGEGWRRYRRQGGSRDRVIADFLIGAHAEVAADRLLTRDRGFYRSCFEGLTILAP